MKKTTLSLLAAASIGLCSSFTNTTNVNDYIHKVENKHTTNRSNSFDFYTVTRFKATVNGATKTYDRCTAGSANAQATVSGGHADYIKINVERGWYDFTRGERTLGSNFSVTYENKRLVSGTVKFDKHNYSQNFIIDGKTSDNLVIHIEFTLVST